MQRLYIIIFSLMLILVGFTSPYDWTPINQAHAEEGHDECKMMIMQKKRNKNVGRIMANCFGMMILP